MHPIKNTKANKMPIPAIPMNVNILLGFFWNKVTNNNICPVNGNIIKG
jgi:hypothetical protein